MCDLAGAPRWERRPSHSSQRIEGEAGFSRTEAIKIATLKRAVYLSKDKHAPPDIMCTGEWEWLRCPRKCPRSEMSDFIPTGFPVLLS